VNKFCIIACKIGLLAIVEILFFVKKLQTASITTDYHLSAINEDNSRALKSIYKINIASKIVLTQKTIDEVLFLFASGGKVITIYIPQPSQVVEIINRNNLVAGVDGTFFGMNDPESSQIIGPVLSNKNIRGFIAGMPQDIIRIKGRPLVLIRADSVKFLPFNPERHNTLSGVNSELPSVTDVFVAGGWLVKKGQPQTATSFGNLYKVNEPRRRAFWGLNAQSRPTLGISTTNIGAVKLGELLAKEGWKEAVMLDSGQSTSLAYKGKSLVNYTPRPVPHVVGLVE
jgi:poly-beta-1,6-N-acetyl-D-glucosamine N-deacetylase